MPGEEAAQPEETVEFTNEAVAKLNEVIGGVGRPVVGLRLQIAGRHEGQFEHILSLLEPGEEPAGDRRVSVPGIPVPVFLEASTADYLGGVKVHYRFKGPDQSGLEFTNPNPLWLDDTSNQIQQIIDTELNPAIAAHGGFITLIAVEGPTAYIEMGGGCQGCGLADVTLKQGVEASIVGVVPGIEHVVDRTDHASGTNPYYQPSKK